MSPQAACMTDWGYVIHAASGQLGLLTRTVPVDQAATDPALTDEQRAKIGLIQDVRVFARDRIGLNTQNYYTSYFNSGEQPTAINVSASQRDRFEARTWDFPFVGTVPYLGYFDIELARQKRDELTGQGLDVFMYEIDAYSTGGLLPNPILSRSLRRPEYDLVDLTIHELTHATIWRANDTTYNENLATFVGRAGARQYFAERYPDDPSRMQAALDGFEDEDRFYAFFLALYRQVNAFYQSSESSAAKVAGREGFFQSARAMFASEVQPLMHEPAKYEFVQMIPINNAYLLGIVRYNVNLDSFQGVFDRVHGEWPAALEVFRGAAQFGGDPFEFLRNWAGAGDRKRVADASARASSEFDAVDCPRLVEVCAP